MESFLMRTVSIESESVDGLKAIRSRNSKGWSCIKITIGKDTVEFDSGAYGSNYEQAAIEFARLLAKVAANPCVLPIVPD